MTTEIQLPIDATFVKQRAAANGEPEWFVNLRLQALEQANSLELPKPDKTNISKWDFVGSNFETASKGDVKLEQLPEEVRALLSLDETNKTRFVSVDGKVVYTSLSEELKTQGVIFTDLATAVREHSDLVQKYYATAVKTDEHKLTALHTALVNGGTFLYVPRNVVVEEPIQSVFYASEEGAHFYNHVLVVAETNSQVTYVENYVGSENVAEGTIANIISEVIVGDNAKVTFGAVDTLSKPMVTYVNRRGIVGRDGRLEWALGLMNEGNTISENITNLMGDGSYADTKTVTVGRGKQTQNFTTSVIHFGKRSEGYILKHGVQKDEASSIFNGIGKIEHGATKANAEQTSRVLMLNDKARGDANPILLIDEDDVTAGHAASVGKVDPMQLFYMMSRGIPRKEAERLIIHGFLAPVVNELPIEEVKQQLVSVIERKVK